jgi:hypothetical protein
MSDVNWPQVRADYEAGGTSLRQLATKYGVSKTYLIERRDKEKWNRPDRPTITDHRPPTTMPLPPKLLQLPIPDDAVSIARIGLHQLAQHLQTDTLLEVRDHKSLSDALAQYVKILQTAPQEPETKEGLVIPLEKLSPYTRQEIRRLLVEDARQQGRTG